MSGLLGPVTANPLMMAQTLKAREQPRKQLTGQGLLDTAAIGLSPVPVIGDALGLAADASRFYNEPESRTPLNFGLAALGAIPFIPPLVSMGLGKFAQSQGKTLSAPSMSGPAKNQAGAIVYHGSPHKFDQFDSSKIGTGEGAQAYGHGLYFAENPAVATQYRDALSAGELRLGDGTPYDPKNIKHFAAATMLDYKTPADAIKDINNQIKELGQINASWRTQAIADKKALIAEIQKGGLPKLEEISHGSLYKVDLPDEAIAKMLDYDAPLSKQPEAVKVAAKDLGLPPTATGKDIYQALSNQARDMAIIKGKNAQTTMGASQANASSDLLGFGVPGIRYLDGGSRGAGEGTRNFVVFPGNEGLLKILERQ